MSAFSFQLKHKRSLLNQQNNDCIQFSVETPAKHIKSAEQWLDLVET